MKDDKETNQIIRTVKELFMKNIKNNKELSILIDKYLIPQELEKKSNAEVSTPFKLRQEMLDKLVNGVEKINLIESRSAYGHDKKWVQKIKTDEYKYPVVYSVNRKNEATFHYSNKNDNGHFGYNKVIFGSGATGFIIDENGEYGLTQWATGIEDKIENLNQIKNVISSTKFMDEVIKATSVSKAEINRKILKYFKKDFWKEFI